MANPLAADAEGVIAFRSKNPFEFQQILQDLEAQPDQRVFGTLIFPERPIEPVPVVVCCHGSMGWRGHHHEHMVKLLEAGIGVFRIHHFDARGVQSIVQDQIRVTAAMLIVDAYRALQKLVTHPRVAAERIGITGWSLGGMAALYSAFEPLREAIVGADGPRFRAHLPFYPAAHVWPEEQRWSPAPIRILHGADDDYTPAHFVTSLAERMGPDANVEVILYPEGRHSFDSIEPTEFIPDAVRLGRKHTTLARDGSMYVTGSDGTRHPVGERSERKQSIAKANNLGAHTGGSFEIRPRAFADMLTFFTAELFAG